MPVSRRGFLSVLMGAFGAGAAARPTFASGGVVVGIDGGALVGEAVAETITPANAGGFLVPKEFSDHLIKEIYLSGAPIRSIKNVTIDMRPARLLDVGWIGEPERITRDDRSGNQAPGVAHNHETCVQLALPQPDVVGQEM